MTALDDDHFLSGSRESRRQRLERLAQCLTAGSGEVWWLLDQITQLEQRVVTLKEALRTLEARDQAMLGLRNDLQAIIEDLQNQRPPDAASPAPSSTPG